MEWTDWVFSMNKIVRRIMVLTVLWVFLGLARFSHRNRSKPGRLTWKMRIFGRSLLKSPTSPAIALLLIHALKVKVTVVSNAPMGKEAVYEMFLSVLNVHGFAAIPSEGYQDRSTEWCQTDGWKSENSKTYPVSSWWHASFKWKMPMPWN